jgi:hypothetical protein
MRRFENVLTALVEGGHVRRGTWREDSTMYTNENKQLMRTSSVHTTSYSWVLDVNDLTATDWQVVEPTSNHQQTQL